MIILKDSFKNLLSIAVLFLIGYFSQSKLIVVEFLSEPLMILKVYVFHAIFTFIVLIVFNILSKKPKIREQLAFVYLGVLMFKITLFGLVFYYPIFNVELTNYQSFSLLIPTLIFIVLEVISMLKIINKK